MAVHLLEREDVGVQRGHRLRERPAGVVRVGARGAVRGERLTVQQIEGGDAQLAHTARRYLLAGGRCAAAALTGPA